jgi:hypothetical protein
MFERLERSEVILILAVSFFAITGVAGLALDRSVSPHVIVDPVDVRPVQAVAGQTRLDAVGWFGHVRQHCNPVEVETYMKWQPAPPNPDGDMYKAACYALAGRIVQARQVIQSLPPGLRYQAAGVVFEAGHPAADAGDDIAAGPLMELVVEYWPNHYMALYHAGAARFEVGDFAVAEGYLKRFLEEYQAADGWTESARSMLERID